MSTSPARPARTTATDGRVAVEVAPGVIVRVPPSDAEWRMDAADVGEYRRDPAYNGIVAARCDAAASPRTRRAVDRINARARANIEAESAALRRKLAANERMLGRPASLAARGDGAPPPSVAARPAAPAPRRTSAPVPTAATARSKIEPDARLDSSGLSPAERHRARQLALSDRRTDAMERSIASVLAERAARNRPAARDPLRQDEMQAGPRAAAARRSMIDRNRRASRPRYQ